MLDRIYHELRKLSEFRNVKNVPARVPIVKFDLDASVVDYKEENFEFDIQCNCVAGIYNSFLLGGLVK